MTAEYVIGLLGLVGSLFGAAAFVWAVRHRQLQTEDEAMYKAVAGDEMDYSEPVPASPSPRRVRWLFVLALTLVFSLIGFMIVQTVRVASRTAVPPPAARK